MTGYFTPRRIVRIIILAFLISSVWLPDHVLTIVTLCIPLFGDKVLAYVQLL